ncbi:outer membrane beta-barrel protein [Longimicrobium sp.]|jgi:opacity protein-like surface antigen|uniref:outer membrane beta-barrel protein n=1 Tax=Longimicrobium sp. TaxID=2029185 RepID=UPI002ED787E4
MKRTLIASALFAGTMLSAGGLDAQVSKNSGFLLNLHVAGNSIETTLEDMESERETGGGLGLGLGYGFGETFALVINLDAASVSSDDDDADEDAEDLALAHFDIGGRLNFGSTASALRPYVNAAFSGVAEGTTSEDADENVTISGAGFTLGGGLQYFFSPRFALDAGLQGSFGKFNQIQLGDESSEIDEDVKFTTARLQLGVTFHP